MNTSTGTGPMLGRGEFWTGFGIIATVILTGLGAVFTLIMMFHNDASQRFNRIDQNQIEQTQRLGEINGAVTQVQALDSARVQEVMTALGYDPEDAATENAQVYLTSVEVNDRQLLDISEADATELTSMVTLHEVAGRELRCVRLTEQAQRQALVCSPRAQLEANAMEVARQR